MGWLAKVRALWDNSPVYDAAGARWSGGRGIPGRSRPCSADGPHLPYPEVHGLDPNDLLRDEIGQRGHGVGDRVIGGHREDGSAHPVESAPDVSPAGGAREAAFAVTIGLEDLYEAADRAGFLKEVIWTPATVTRWTGND